MVHQCNECHSSFREKKNLQQHMRKRHGLKRYKCSYCNDRFDNRTSRSGLKKSNMKMSCLIANNVNTLQLEKID